MVMVKPALAYGDLIRAVGEATGMPVAAYNVSGEYAMVKAAAAAGHIDERATVLEILTSLRRARGRDDHHLPRKGRRRMASREELISEDADAQRAAATTRRSVRARTARRCRSTTSTGAC